MTFGEGVYANCMHLGNTIFQKREQSCSREESEKDQMRVSQKMSSDA